jgi:predicted Zn-dependent protease
MRIFLRKVMTSLYRRPGLSVPLLLAAVALIGLGIYHAAQSWLVERNFRAAQEALERDDFDQARAQLARCLRLRPRNAAFHLLAARTARRAGDVAVAEAQLDLCQGFDPNTAGLQLERALLEAQTGRLAGAVEFLRDEVEKDTPDAVLILEALTQGYRRTDRLSFALRCLNRWLNLRPNTVTALVWRGEVHEQRGEPEDALADFRRAVELAPDRFAGRLHLAQLLVRQQQYEEAVGHLQYLYDEAPGDAAVVLGLAQCRRAQQRTAEAKQLLQSLVNAGSPEPQVLAEFGKLLRAEGREADAEYWLREAVGRAPYDREANYQLFLCLVKRGKKEEAKKYQAAADRIAADLKRMTELTKEIAQHPQDPAPRCEAGKIMLANSQEEAARHWLDGALREDPSYAPAHEALAELYTRQKEYDLAAQHRRRAEQCRQEQKTR